MTERIKGSYDDALYKSTYTLLYFTQSDVCIQRFADTSLQGARHGTYRPLCSVAIMDNRPAVPYADIPPLQSTEADYH